MITRRFVLACIVVLFSSLDKSALAEDENAAVDYVARVNGEPVSQGMFEFLVDARSQGPLSGLEQNRAQVLEDLLTTELLFQSALKANTHRKKRNQYELELAHKTLLSQLYVMEFMSDLLISEDVLKEAYDQISEPVMLQMQRWDFSSQLEAEAFLEQYGNTGQEPLLEGQLEPWQDQSSWEVTLKTSLMGVEAGAWLAHVIASGEDGWQVWRCVDRSEITKPSFDEAREGLRQEFAQQRLAAHIAELKQFATIEIQLK